MIDKIIELAKQLPPEYVFVLVLLVFLALLGWLVWESRKNREVRLFWGAITLGPRSSAINPEMMRELMESVENAHREMEKLTNHEMSVLNKLLDEERQLRDKTTGTNLTVSQDVALKQGIDRLHQDRLRIEQNVISKLSSVELQLKSVDKKLEAMRTA